MSLRTNAKELLRFWRRRGALARFRRKDTEEDHELPYFNDPALLASTSLLAEQQRKLAVFSELIGKSRERAVVELYDRMISGLPDLALHAFLLPDLHVESCQRVSDDLLRLEIKGGRKFFGQRSNQKEYWLHHAFSYYLPHTIDGDAYKLALDVQRRYLSPRLHWYNSHGGIFVEGGCFTGMKAIRWHDISPQPVRILAVEIGKTNSEILSANIHENNLEDAITPIHAGLWRESGEGMQKHAFSTRRFLQSSDLWNDHMLYEEKVRLLSIGDLLDETKVEVADYFNVQVNGAEIDVLEGAGAALDRVKVFDVAAYYSKDGKTKNVDVVREFFLQKGCTILQESGRGRIAAVTPKFRDEILSRKPKSKKRPSKS